MVESNQRTPPLGISAIKLCVELGGRQILSDVTLSIPGGSSLSLIGPSGAGKTTLLRSLAGLLRPSAGSVGFVMADGTPVRPVDVSLGFVFQDLGIFENSSVRENIYLGNERCLTSAYGAEILDALDLTPLLDRQVTSVSGGERQRTAIARALVRRPAIIFLDEVFSNVDQRLATAVELKLIDLQLRFGFTMLYVTHNLASAGRLSERIAYMQDGRIHQEGTLQELLHSPATDAVLSFVSPVPPFRIDALRWQGVAPDIMRTLDGGFVRADDAFLVSDPGDAPGCIHRPAAIRRRMSTPHGEYTLVSFGGESYHADLAVVADRRVPPVLHGTNVWVAVPYVAVRRSIVV